MPDMKEVQQLPPTVTAYVAGKTVPIEGAVNQGSAILEVRLDDGRTVQLCVNNDGGVNLRGWGNVPGKVGNSTRLDFSAYLPHEDPTTCETCLDKLGGCGCG